MPFCEDVTGTAFQVLFEMLSLFNRLERDINLDLPWDKFGSMGTFLGVVVHEPLSEICRMTNVTLVSSRFGSRMCRTCNGLPSIAWNPIGERSSFAEAMEDTLETFADAPVPSEGW